MDDFVGAAYGMLKQKRKFAVYAALVRACDERSLVAPSYKTFTQAANRRPRQEQIAKRQGPRAGFQAAPFYWEIWCEGALASRSVWSLAHSVVARVGRDRARGFVRHNA
jgi:hypothetical protein